MYGPNYELLVTKLWFNNNIYYQNDGVVYPGKDIWWNTGINWEQYAPDEGPYFQKCLFKADSINVVCKNKPIPYQAETSVMMLLKPYTTTNPSANTI